MAICGSRALKTAWRIFFFAGIEFAKAKARLCIY